MNPFNAITLKPEDFLKNEADFRPTGTFLRYLRREKEIADYGSYSDQAEAHAKTMRPLFFLLEEAPARAHSWLVKAARLLSDGTVKAAPQDDTAARFLKVKRYYRAKYQTCATEKNN